jgi:putative ABC transport system substrate-binding protein
VRRREFITLVGSAAAWPLSGYAQQGQQLRRIGILLNAAADDPQFKTWVEALLPVAMSAIGT